MERLNIVRQQPGNGVCAECRENSRSRGYVISPTNVRSHAMLYCFTSVPVSLVADPEWCCLNRGVFLCITCAGIHRRLHSSIVRSCRLDAWKHHMVDVSRNSNVKPSSTTAQVLHIDE